MTRRNFILASVVGLSTLALLNNAPKPKLSKEERDALVAKAFETPEGRRMLAQAMETPIRCGGWEYCQDDGALIKNRRKPCPKCGKMAKC